MLRFNCSISSSVADGNLYNIKADNKKGMINSVLKSASRSGVHLFAINVGFASKKLKLVTQVGCADENTKQYFSKHLSGIH